MQPTITKDKTASKEELRQHLDKALAQAEDTARELEDPLAPPPRKKDTRGKSAGTRRDDELVNVTPVAGASPALPKLTVTAT